MPRSVIVGLVVLGAVSAVGAWLIVGRASTDGPDGDRLSSGATALSVDAASVEVDSLAGTAPSAPVDDASFVDDIARPFAVRSFDVASSERFPDAFRDEVGGGGVVREVQPRVFEVHDAHRVICLSYALLDLGGCHKGAALRWGTYNVTGLDDRGGPTVVYGFLPPGSRPKIEFADGSVASPRLVNGAFVVAVPVARLDTMRAMVWRNADGVERDRDGLGKNGLAVDVAALEFDPTAG